MGGRFGESCGHFGLLFVFSTLLHTINDPILFRMRVLGGGGGGLGALQCFSDRPTPSLSGRLFPTDRFGISVDRLQSRKPPQC